MFQQLQLVVSVPHHIIRN